MGAQGRSVPGGGGVQVQGWLGLVDSGGCVSKGQDGT